jgi:hypothetical protein
MVMIVPVDADVNEAHVRACFAKGVNSVSGASRRAVSKTMHAMIVRLFSTQKCRTRD